MPDQFGGIEVGSPAPQTDQFGGVPIAAPAQDQFGGIAVSSPPQGAGSYLGEFAKGAVRGAGTLGLEAVQGVSRLGTDVIAPAIGSHPNDFGLAQWAQRQKVALQQATAPAPGWEGSTTGKVGEMVGEIAPAAVAGVLAPESLAPAALGRAGWTQPCRSGAPGSPVTAPGFNASSACAFRRQAATGSSPAGLSNKRNVVATNRPRP